jgi:hypothetical protein
VNLVKAHAHTFEHFHGLPSEEAMFDPINLRERAFTQEAFHFVGVANRPAFFEYPPPDPGYKGVPPLWNPDQRTASLGTRKPEPCRPWHPCPTMRRLESRHSIPATLDWPLWGFSAPTNPATDPAGSPFTYRPFFMP